MMQNSCGLLEICDKLGGGDIIMKKTFICPCCKNKFKAKLQSIMMCNKCKFFFSHNVVPNEKVKENIKCLLKV